MAGFYFAFLQIVLSLGMLKLGFTSLFKTTAHLPEIDAAGNSVITEKVYSHTLIAGLWDSDYSILAIVLLVMKAASVVLGVISVFMDQNKALVITGRVVFALTIIMFILCFVLEPRLGGRY